MVSESKNKSVIFFFFRNNEYSPKSINHTETKTLKSLNLTSVFIVFITYYMNNSLR